METLTEEQRQLYIADVQMYINDVPYKHQISKEVLHSENKDPLTKYDDLVPFSQCLSAIASGVREVVVVTVRNLVWLPLNIHVSMHL